MEHLHNLTPKGLSYVTVLTGTCKLSKPYLINGLTTNR